jgi:hypothetical protein
MSSVTHHRPLATQRRSAALALISARMQHLCRNDFVRQPRRQAIAIVEAGLEPLLAGLEVAVLAHQPKRPSPGPPRRTPGPAAGNACSEG